MRHRTSQIIYAYWNEVRRGRLAPRRFDIEPARLAGILAETMILEHTDGCYRFRLAGTRITEQFATELRGRDFLELWESADRLAMSRHLATLETMGGVLVVEFEGQGVSGRRASFEAIVMPLIHTREVVDRFLGAISAGASPFWLGSEPLERLSVIGAEVIWPEGRPHEVAQRMVQQPPALAPEMAAGRVVRLARRQFRVLDGGLTGRGVSKE